MFSNSNLHYLIYHNSTLAFDQVKASKIAKIKMVLHFVNEGEIRRQFQLKVP